jgi:hypothetical protein
MSAAGFFQVNFAGCLVACFVCNIRVHSFVAFESPMRVHASINPECEYVRFKKSKLYIQNAKHIHTENDKQRETLEGPWDCPAESSEDELDTPVEAAIRCVICADKARDVVLEPCFHFVSCKRCIIFMQNDLKCPVCRQKVTRLVEVFYP